MSELFPAIDLRRGKVVRLEKGLDERRTEYSRSPLEVLREYSTAGARWTHVVDLDAAFGESPQLDLIATLAANDERPNLQIGGGLRSAEAVERVLELGVERAVVGSLVVKDPDAFADIARSYPGRVVPALDVQGGDVMIAGWRERGPSWQAVAERLRGLPCPAVLVTDIDRDGTLDGPNVALAAAVGRACGFPGLVSGGVSRRFDLHRIAAESEVAGAVVGKALYEGRFTVEEALAAIARPSELTVRIIPCLDVADGRVVKGVNFVNLVDEGDPVEAARRYATDGADEIVFLDVSASHEARGTRLGWVRAVAASVFVPLTVGGGVRTVEDARALLEAGADKVAINTAAVDRPALIDEIAERFGRQCVVLSVDARRRPDGGSWEVVTHGGRRPVELDAIEWMVEGERRGAGDVLLTSMDADGTQFGYDLDLIRAATNRVRIPIIASGGAGRAEHLVDALRAGANAVLAASIFHRHQTTVGAVKELLGQFGFPVREVPV